MQTQFYFTLHLQFYFTLHLIKSKDRLLSNFMGTKAVKNIRASSLQLYLISGRIDH